MTPKGRFMRSKSAYIMATVSLVIFIVWLALLVDTSAAYQNAASTDPLAMIHVLFPHFWILLLAFVPLYLVALRSNALNKQLHILLLCQLALVLYFTPFALSGFSWSPDSLWHGGIATYMPEVLGGAELAYSSYAQSYPLSFTTTFLAEMVSGVDVLTYTLYVYPPICIVTFTMLGYVLASRLLGGRRAFLAMLLALPALHFIEPHVSPFSAGTLLVLTSLVLLTLEGRIARTLNFFVIVALTLTHPVSPVSLGIFLVAALLLNAMSRTARRQGDLLYAKSNLTSPLLFVGIVWFAWTMYHSISIYKTVEYAISDIVTLRFVSRLFYVSEWTAGGEGFIYPEIHNLSLEIYVAFLAVVSVLLLVDFIRVRSSRSDSSEDSREIYRRIALATSSICYAGFGYLLFLASSQRFLLGRGLLFFILMGSMCMSAYLAVRNLARRTLREGLAILFVSFLLVSFPIISYSKEAYNTFTPSSGSGLEFISSRGDLSARSFSMGVDQQIVAYANISQGIMTVKYPPILNGTDANFIVLRSTSYFVRAMRIDLSFEDNGYTQLKADLMNDTRYSKIYCNPTFEVYSSDLY